MDHLASRLSLFFQQIASNCKPVESSIGQTAHALFRDAKFDKLNLAARSDFVPSQLDALLTQHSSAELSSLANVATELPWTPTKTKAKLSPALAQLAAVELIGPTGLIHADNARAGLLVQPPNTRYPQHRHAAEELYYVLSGHAQWGQNLGPTASYAPGAIRHHAAWEWHEMITDAEPLLALWCWIGDIRFDQYEIR